MNNLMFRDELIRISGDEHVLPNEPMAKHTTFRIGGPASFFVTVGSEEEIRDIRSLCMKEDVPFFIMGNGSNLLVSDKGFEGVVVRLGREFGRVTVEGCTIRAEAGALLSQIAAQALANRLTGFEFAAGIPGTLGGACMMNAGAYGGEMKQVLKEITYLDQDGEIRTIPAAEAGLSYRHSNFMENGAIVLSAVIELTEGVPEEIRAVMNDLRGRRQEKQPLELPSAGSTFKRPEGYFAGKLIMDSGLRGYTVGGAQVSEKHCGFVVNKGNATAADVNTLIQDVSRIVLEKYGVELSPEVRFLGDFS